MTTPCRPRRRASPRRRRQVRLLRRVPADAPRPRGRAARRRRALRDRGLPGGDVVALAGTLRRPLRGGLGLGAGPPRADRGAPAPDALPRHDRRLRHRRRHPGAAQLGRPRRVPGRGLRPPGVDPLAGPLHARSPSTWRWTPSCAAARSTRASSWSSSPRSPPAAGRSCRDEAVCMECKRRGVVCVMVSKGIPCLGQVTQTGCGAICPRFGRGCYGCFGPREQANAAGLTRHLQMAGDRPREEVGPALRRASPRTASRSGAWSPSSAARATGRTGDGGRRRPRRREARR